MNSISVERIEFRQITSFVIWIFKFIYLRIKLHGKLIFPFSCRIFPGSKFEGANRIGCNSIINGDMGFGSYMGNNCSIYANIGRFTSIAPNVIVNPGLHPHTFPFATTCPMFFSPAMQNGYSFCKKKYFNEFKPKVSIGHDCWIGEKVFIVGGVKIGNGAVVLGGAYVTKDVPDYAVVGGVPAKVLKYRYDDSTIQFLQKIEWWNNSIEWFDNNWKLLIDMDKLKEYYYEK